MRVAGAMSGTSLDGVDLAVIESDGVAITGFGQTAYRPYSEVERVILRSALGLWPGEAGVAEAAEVIEDAHLDLARDLGPIAAFGFHGQTLAHAPGLRGTHQAGDGERLARELGCPVVWDFRSSDVELGGQGAPLAPFFHWACARWIGAGGAPLAFLNLGGVGNLTWADPLAAAPDAPGALLAFDTGPANAPLDDLMQVRGLGAFDLDGALALAGQVDRGVVAAFLEDRFFVKIPPKSLDRGHFGHLVEKVSTLPDADAMATLVGCILGSVVRGMEHMPAPPAQLLVTGGGRKNPALMTGLQTALDIPVLPVEAVGLDGDFLEAQAFAYLALRVMRGMTTSAPGTTGVAAAVGGGRISQ
ncbi:anhydro-N-acetylmuramic acid kinase [Rhodophyticola sp. CCM32]|uniref:anhydro-N-acetylmuramic acid kinase n=1 Tax=Rhodophyticola sp. CCM32 TaxID=2916397 RepID=UPI00107F1327|nr:anhydro-N-acetylmuramic acid kinase [Rhodophyticola sp. CCM32]QBY00747.1 anhydro-N-acetylmuramic acid kinase [Rhodophyticola sp. CCM32]